MLYISAETPISVTWTDYPDNKECAVIVYFSGCGHDCPGCQNSQLRYIGSGKQIAWHDLLNLLIEECKRSHTDNIVFSGGDCAYQNLEELNELLYNLVKIENYRVCIYTGYGIGFCKENFKYATYYKCGTYQPYKKEKEWGKFADRMVFATKNQKLYDSDYRQISVDNVYWFKKFDTFKAKIVKFFKGE